MTPASSCEHDPTRPECVGPDTDLSGDGGVEADTDANGGDTDVPGTIALNAVHIEPSVAYNDDELRCAVEMDDPTGEAVLTRLWTRVANGAELGTGEFLDLSAGSLWAPGDVVRCRATLVRGLLELADATTVTLSNRAPVVDSVVVSPPSPVRGEVVTCAAEATDADGDDPVLSYAWSTGAVGPSVTVSASEPRGTVLVCTATATDARDGALTDSSTGSATVANTPPVVASVALSPLSPLRGDVVTCAAEATDADGDAPVLSYAWSTGAVGPSVTVSASEPRGTVLVCTATATDALDGALTDSSTGSVTVANTPPVVAHVGIAPEVARTQDTLTAVVEASDVDGDALSFGYLWEVNGEVVPDEDGSSLGSSHFVKGDAVVLSVTADDGSDTSDGVSSPRVIANTAPGAPVVAVTPADAVEGDALTCAVVTAAVDPDVDDGVDTLTYSFSWTVDGSAFPGATDSALSSVVSGDDVGLEEQWVCEAVASDGEDAGEAGEAAVFVEATSRLGVVRYIPAGSFTMGCVQGRDSVEGVVCDPPSPSFAARELPTRTVTLTQGLWMMESELTQGMWTGLGFTNPSTYSGTNRPVERVNWWEAVEAANEASRRDGLAVCYTLTGCDSNAVGSNRICTGVTVTSASGHPKDCEGWRLPTEAEWEYAARAGTSFPFSGGSDVSEVAWYDSNSGGQTKVVCTAPTPRNAWGLCDMSGNVWEWTWDWFTDDYNGAATTDPAGPASGWGRANRGGSWFSGARGMRVADRDGDSPSTRNVNLGFRLVRSNP